MQTLYVILQFHITEKRCIVSTFGMLPVTFNASYCRDLGRSVKDSSREVTLDAGTYYDSHSCGWTMPYIDV